MLLIDTNIIIGAHKPTDRRAKNFIAGHDVCVSILSKVEALGVHAIEPTERVAIAAFFALVPVLPVDDAIAEQAIALRQQKSIGLGDALIAATALVRGLRLITRNTGDFGWIEDLELFNPYAVGDPV